MGQALAASGISSEERPSRTSKGSASASMTGGDRWIAIRAMELQRAYDEFARESGRLARLARKKKRVRIPSEGFNQILAEQMEEVERLFLLYMRRKQELLTYLQTAARRNEVADQQKVRPGKGFAEAQEQGGEAVRAAS